MKNHYTRPTPKRELSGSMAAVARQLEKATGEPYGAIVDRMLKEQAERDELGTVRAYAAANTAQQPEPVAEALPPRTPARGPRDLARIKERGQTAQRIYLAAGDSRDLSELVIKHPQYYDFGASASRDPRWALRKLPPSVRGPLLLCATRGGTRPIEGEYSRGLIATLYLIFRLARRTKRSAMQIVAGCSGGFLGSCIPSYSGRTATLSAQTLTARRHNGAPEKPGTKGPHDGFAGDAMRHECGYIEALRQIGVLVAFQPPSDAVPKWQIGRRGYACLQFLLLDSVWCVPEPEHDPPP